MESPDRCGIGAQGAGEGRRRGAQRFLTNYLAIFQGMNYLFRLMKNVLSQFSIETEIALSAPASGRDAREQECEEQRRKEYLDMIEEYDWKDYVAQA